MTIEVSTQNPRSVKALVIFAQCDAWQQGHTKEGRPFFAIPSCSEPGLFHMVDQRECTCQDFKRRGGPASPCKHVIAVRFWMAAFATGAVAPKPRPGATADDDRIALTPEGAEYLAAQPKLTAEALWGQTCRVRGCTDDGSPDCARHQLVSAF